MTTAVLATRLIAGLGCLVDVARVIYDGVEAKQITDAEGIDIGAEIAEITFLCHGLSTPSQYQQCVDGPGLTSGQTQICWGIVYGSVFLITALESLNGWGPPDPGKDFTDGQKKIDHVNTILAGAGPQPDQWSDSGAATYDEANKTLAALVQRLATSDAAVVENLKHQAGQVNDAREQLAAARMSLVGVLMLMATISGEYFSYTKALGRGVEGAGTAALVAADDAGEALDRQTVKNAGKQQYLASKGMTEADYGYMKSWQQWLDGWLPLIVLPPCIAAIATVSACLGILIPEGNSNADGMRKRRDEYRSIANDAAAMVTGSPSVGGVMAPALPRTAPSFSALPRVAGTAGATALSSRADLAHGLSGSHAQAEIVAGGGVRRGDGPPVITALPPWTSQPQKPPQPQRAAAAPAEAEQRSGLAAAVAAGVAQHLNLADPPTGRMRNLVSQAQRRPARVERSDSPEEAPTEAALAEEASWAEAGAMPSAGHTPGVPVGIATGGTEPVQEQTWAQRNLG